MIATFILRCLVSVFGVAGLLEFKRQLLTAGLLNAAVGQHMHLVRYDVIQKPLIVRDDEERAILITKRIDALRNDLERVDVETRNPFRRERTASAREAPSAGFPSASSRAPENPTLTGRFSISISMLSFWPFSFTSFKKAGVVSSASPRFLRTEFSAVLRNVSPATPGISIGYWKARKTPFAARSSGSMSMIDSPFQRMSPSVTS